MKVLYSSLLFGLTMLGLMMGCDEPEYATPNLAAKDTTFSAKVLFVHASPDAPALNLFVNNLPTAVGASVAYPQIQPTYTTIPLLATGGPSAGNTHLRAKAVSGQIGGVLGSADVVFRASGTNQNTFVANTRSSYTIFVTDTIARPKSRTPGTTDVGGIQLWSVADLFPSNPIPAGKSAIRFIHLAPNLKDTVTLVNSATGTTPFPKTISKTDRPTGKKGDLTNTHLRIYRNVFLEQTLTVDNVTFRANTNLNEYTVVDAGMYTYEVRTKTETGTLLVTMPPVTLVEGKIYTFYLRGKVGSTTTPLGVETILHN